jgi:hypothetical protein
MGPSLSSGFQSGASFLIGFFVSLFDLEPGFFAPTRSIAKPARVGAVKVWPGKGGVRRKVGAAANFCACVKPTR